MTYRVFNTQTELDSANERWMTARHEAGVFDCCMGKPIAPRDITARFSNGKLTLDNRLACQVPDRWATEFGGEEIELTDIDFPVVETEV